MLLASICYDLAMKIRKRLNDLTGQTFGFLEVLRACERPERAPKSRNSYWECRCVCGKVYAVDSMALKRGQYSCGCMGYMSTGVHVGAREYKHGFQKHPLYQVWWQMKARCDKPNHSAYYWYGARGIRFCDEWRDPEVFILWALANGYEKGLQIDRRDNNGDYEPSNCRFVTRAENMKNRRPRSCQKRPAEAFA